MPFLRQSTSQLILFGPCLDKTDGVTEETALTLAQADMRLSKDGGAFAQKSAAGNATHDSDGWYSTTLSTTDTATVGELRLNVHQPANMLPVWDRWWVLEEAIYDAIYGAAAAGFDGNQRVDVGSWIGTAVTLSGALPDVNVETMDAASIASGVIAAGELTNIENEIWNALKSAHTTPDSFGDFLDIEISSRLASADISLTGGAVDTVTAVTNDVGITATAVNLFWDEAMTETTGAPAVTASFREALKWMFALSRNEINQTATLLTLRNDADDGDLATSVVSDDATTYIRGEWSV